MPEGTTRVVGRTRLGEEIIGIPYERMAFLWWPGDLDDLTALYAETPGETIDLTED